MHAGAEINQAAILAEDVLRPAVPHDDSLALAAVVLLTLYIVGKQVQVAEPVSPELDRQLGRGFQTEDDDPVAGRTARDAPRKRAHDHFVRRFPRNGHLDFHRLIHVELGQGGAAARVHVDFHGEDLQLPPFTAASRGRADEDAVATVLREIRVFHTRIDHYFCLRRDEGKEHHEQSTNHFLHRAEAIYGFTGRDPAGPAPRPGRRGEEKRGGLRRFATDAAETCSPPSPTFGADTRTRTGDPRITNALLYQLSHIGKDFSRKERRFCRKALPLFLKSAGTFSENLQGFF